jgi:hypothetical protein
VEHVQPNGVRPAFLYYITLRRPQVIRRLPFAKRPRLLLTSGWFSFLKEGFLLTEKCRTPPDFPVREHNIGQYLFNNLRNHITPELPQASSSEAERAKIKKMLAIHYRCD